MTHNPLVIPPGEPSLVKALSKAAAARGARHVHQYAGVSGWHTSDVVPRSIPAYFRVSAKKIWIRTEGKVEILVATVVNGSIIPEERAAEYFAALAATV